jgi:hypothetical protein
MSSLFCEYPYTVALSRLFAGAAIKAVLICTSAEGGLDCANDVSMNNIEMQSKKVFLMAVSVDGIVIYDMLNIYQLM